jgi:hypothetical protein
LEVRIQSAYAGYINGEPIKVAFAVRNTGSDALTLPALTDAAAPQPYFVVQGPSYPKAHRLHWRGKAPRPDQLPRRTVELTAGQTVNGSFTLPVSLGFPTPGVHELHATYEWHGQVFESNHVKVTIDAPGAPMFRVVGRTPLTSELGIQALSVSGPTLYLATFDEDRPDLGEVFFTGFARLLTTEPDATDHFAPWCQTAQAGAIGPRFGWRTGNAISVAGYRKLPQRIDLDFKPRIHAPSLMSANGDIDVLVTDGAGRQLSLIRFPNVGYDQAPPPAFVVWRAELAEPAIDLIASLNPTGVHRALVRHAGSVRLMRWDDAGPTFEAPLPVDGQPITGVGPALHVSAAGVVHASVLTAKPSDTRKVVLTQIVWTPGAQPQVTAEAPVDLPSPVRSGTIAYSMRSIESPRRDWVFVLESHRVITSRSAGKAFITKRQVMLPPQVLVMKDMSYDLEVHARPELNLLQ